MSAQSDEGAATRDTPSSTATVAAGICGVSVRPSRLTAVVRSGPARRHRLRVRPIIDRVTGAGQCAPLAGSSVTGLVSDGAGREEM